MLYIDETTSKYIATLYIEKYYTGFYFSEHVNEYLRLASNADKQQLQRIKTIFEKKNQKSTQTISALTKKVENYHKRMNDLDTYGFTGHKQARERLRDLGQGFK